MQKTLGVKADIMNVAEKLFCRFGFNKISMDRIAKESKHAKGSVYYHFSSKINLMNSILESELEKIRTDLLETINDSSLSEPEKIKRYALVRMESMSAALTNETGIPATRTKHHKRSSMNGKASHRHFV